MARRWVPGNLPAHWRDRLIPIALTLLSYALAFAQRPGHAYSDSRAELTVDPSLFLDRVASVWSNTADLGHVQSGQFVGYLTPMAPWFGGADALGIPLWIAERLWLGTVLALSAWGVVRLMDLLFDRQRGIAHLAAGLLYAANPYVVVYVSRGSVTLLAYCALPWLLVATQRALREPGRWRWPLVAGVIFALAGGGVNAAVVAWVLVAPAALIVYEILVDGRSWRDGLGVGARTLCAVIVTSLWWIVPVALQGRYGAQFLSFTERPDAIWATTSMSESLRLLGYWVTYFGTGFGVDEPAMQVAADYLFGPLVILATFAVPLFAFGGLLWTRRWRYGPFFALLAVGTLLVMTIGFPQGKPLSDALTDAYYDVGSIQFLRTPYKAAPLLALSIACLGGAGAAALVAHCRAGRLRLPWSRRRVAAWALVPLVALPVVWAWPLYEGSAVDKELAYDKVPDTWHAAVRDAERATPPNKRMLYLPGQLFGYYRWGRTLDPLPPALSRRPLAIRSISRYSDPRSSQLQAVLDDAVQQRRLVPGQLAPMLRLLGIGQTIVGTDGRGEQTGEASPAEIANSLARQPGFERPAATYGAEQPFVPRSGRGGEPVPLPELRRYSGPADSPGIVRVHPREQPTLLVGDAEGVLQAAAHPGQLDPSRALFYAGDLDADDLRERAANGARLVLTDSNRRRPEAATRLTENRWYALGPDDPLPRELPAYSLFPGGSANQTVALHGDLSYVRSPIAPTFAVFPEHRPAAAFDGDLSRPWIASATGSRAWIEARLSRPHPVRTIRVHPHTDALGRTLVVGVSANGGPERIHMLRAGWNTLPVDSSRLERLRLRIVRVRDVVFTGRGGLDEVQIPGVRAPERLRLPTEPSERLRGADLSRTEVSVLLQRTTADSPYRAGTEVQGAQAENAVHMIDAERGISREVDMPAARLFGVDGWASVAPEAPDRELDRLAGVPRRWRFASSSRFEGVPGQRASSAWDRSPLTSWVGDYLPGRDAWIALRAPRAFTLRRFEIRGDARGTFATPTRVRVTTDAGRSAPLPVALNGEVRMPRAVRTRSLRIDIEDAVKPPGLGAARFLSAVAVSEIVVPGVHPPAPKRTGAFATRCGSLVFRTGLSSVRGRARGTRQELDAGTPLRLETCGRKRALELRQGRNDVDAPAGAVVRPDHVRLVSPAAHPAAPAGARPRLTSGGALGATHIDGVRLTVPRPSWLVLAESYSSGWRARCTDARGHEHDLGAPVPADSYANAWPMDPGCVKARFAFASQRAATASYVASALGTIAMLIALGIAALRRRRRTEAAPEDAPRPAPAARPDSLRRLGLARGCALATALGLFTGFVFAWRAGVVLALATLVLALVGVTARRLLMLSTVCFAAVPILYLIDPAPNASGYFFSFAYWHLEAHWVACAGVTALAAAALIDARAFRVPRERPPDRDDHLAVE